MTSSSRLGPKGQVVIPKPIRERLGLRPGDRVIVEQDGASARVSKTRTADDLIGSLPESDLDPMAVLMEERSRERDRENRKSLRLGG
jgi:AbrB family looped-hinge helix DNA binding protein